MTLRDVRGQASAIGTLTRAIETGRVHHAYRFEGPDGVGKTLAAFGLAQALVCAAGDPLGCGACKACEQAVTLREGVPLHPDVIVIERGLYGPDVIDSKERTQISIEQIRRLILAQVPFSPHLGRARVFIVKQADELSVGAANAVLKTLEEPPNKTHFILVTSRPSELLTTIRSRSLPVRFGALDDALVRELLAARGLPSARIDEVMPLAAGSVGKAVLLADEAFAAARQAFVERAIAALRAPSLANVIELAEACEKDRVELRSQLEMLADHFAARARATLEAGVDGAERFAAAHDRTLAAATHLESGQNASTSLTVMELLSELRGAR